jgi:hypothetical protein
MKALMLAAVFTVSAAPMALAQTKPPPPPPAQTQIHQPWEIMTDEAVGKAGLARPAAGAPAGGLVESLDVQSSLDLLTAGGVKGEIVAADGGRFIIANIDGAQFQATPIFCADGQRGCVAMRLSLALAGPRKPPVGLMNAWNNAAPMARGFIDQDGDPVMEMDISVEGGVSRAHVLAQLTRWRDAMAKFQDLIAGFETKAQAPAKPASPPAKAKP